MEYVHGGDVYTAGQKTGRPLEELLDFSANINPFGIPQGVRQALLEAVEDSWRYPDPHCRALVEKLAAREGGLPERILCANGAAELIFRSVQAIRPRKAVLLAPTFAEYEAALQSVGCAVHTINLSREQGFAPSPKDWECLTQEVDMAFLCNPNNPTGLLISRDLLLSAAQICRERGIRLVVDECFLELTGREKEFSLIPFLDAYPQLLVLKAFTKLYAMAGVRLGYCLTADRELLAQMESCGQPWSVSVFAQRAGEAALEETEYVRESVKEIRRQRNWLQRELEKLGFWVCPSQANYLFFAGENTRLQEQLLEKGILVRSCANYRGLDAHYYRIAVRTQAENQRLIEALGELEAKG